MALSARPSATRKSLRQEMDEHSCQLRPHPILHTYGYRDGRISSAPRRDGYGRAPARDLRGWFLEARAQRVSKREPDCTSAVRAHDESALGPVGGVLCRTA